MRLLAFSIFISLCSVHLFAQSGTPDISFGNGGKVISNFAGENDFVEASAIQQDGKILIAGSAGDSLVIVRYLTNGNPDASFGLNGRKLIGYETGNHYGAALAMAVQPDGKIIIGGYWSASAFQSYFILSRFNSSGSPDEHFGSSGVVKMNLNRISVRSIALQQDGKIVVGAGDGLSLYVLRFLSSGAIDTGFGDQGIAPSLFIGNAGGCYVAIQADRKIVAAYTSYADIGLVRYQSNGNFDSTFGTDGRSVNDMSGVDDRAYAIALQPDQKIVIAGGFNFDFASTYFALARFKTNGTPDSTFGTNGKTVKDPSDGISIAYAATLQPDGKIIAAGDINNHFGIVRYRATGIPDSSFGFNGKASTVFGGASDRVCSVLLQADGKIIAAGTSYNNNSTSDFALTRYNNDSFPVTNIKSGLWSDPSTWSNHFLPDETSVIELGFDVTVDINTKCRSLKTGNHIVHINQNIKLLIAGASSPH